MAQVVMDDRLARTGFDNRVMITSSGTGGWHTGEPMDPRAADVLSRHGYDPSRHRARKFSIDAYAENDLLLAMDHANRADMVEQAPSPADARNVSMFRSFDPDASDDADEVPDPWYGGPAGFDNVLRTIERTCEGIIGELPRLLDD